MIGIPPPSVQPLDLAGARKGLFATHWYDFLAALARTPKVVTPAYSASITIDALAGPVFNITATNGVAFTINAPTNPRNGMVITVRIRNASGGALGAITWNAVFKMPAFTSPANSNSRAVMFNYDGTNWVQIVQSAADVPN